MPSLIMKYTYSSTEIKFSKPQLHVIDNVLLSMARMNTDTRIIITGK